MREILFRGKSIATNEWINGSLLEKEGYRQIYHDKGNNPLCNYYIKEKQPTWGQGMVKKDSIGQYTGLTDENGNKIFEGDIVKRLGLDGVFLVRQNAYNCAFSFYNTKGDEQGILHKFHRFEVIGNIHDNPELLKKWQTKSKNK